MTDDTTAAVAAALERAMHQHGASDDPGHVTPDGRPRCFECDDPFPCDSHVLAQEVERLRETLSQVIYAWEQNDRFTATMLEAKQLLRDTHPATAGRGSEEVES